MYNNGLISAINRIAPGSWAFDGFGRVITSNQSLDINLAGRNSDILCSGAIPQKSIGTTAAYIVIMAPTPCRFYRNFTKRSISLSWADDRVEDLREIEGYRTESQRDPKT
jgi:hypothetical protein